MSHEPILLQAGRVEHDPVEIWERTSTAIRTGLNNAVLTASDLAAVGITDQQ